jgi:hypothetical protein
LIAGCGGSSSRASFNSLLAAGAAAGSQIQIKTLSNRADLISGGDAYVEIVLSNPQLASGLRLELNRQDISSAVALRANGRVLGVVNGLVDGENILVASTADGGAARLVITNHPIGGPVISGPQTQPFYCATPTPLPATATSPATNASGLHTFAVDAQCNIATETFFFYRTTKPDCVNVLPDPNPPAPPPSNSCFKPYTPGQPTPADLATTTTDQGLTVSYIVRVERGTIDRGIYDIAVLFNPNQDWKPYAPQRGWNGKVVHTFGASTGQPRRQFRSEQSWVDDSALSRGFMVVDNSMTDSLYNSNRVYNSEALMMTKEHIIETYGEIRYTIGNGCSGGSIQQLTAASIYPGLLDGVQPTCTYPDSETTGMEVSDCVLLVNYFNSQAFKDLTRGLNQAQIDAKKTAISGHLDPTACFGWNNAFGNNNKPGQFVPKLVIDATGLAVPLGDPRNNCQLLPGQVYNPLTNPMGTRCGSWDNSISIFGWEDATPNRGRSTLDNVGIQYGLKALAAGAISAEEFVTLNEQIGGVTPDNEPSPSRSIGNDDALRIAYTTGIVSAGQLGKTPIIDLRGFDERSTQPYGAGPLFGFHQTWRSYALRARLDQANGNHGNHVLWRFGNSLVAPPQSGLTLRSFLTMDRWLANIEHDTSDTSRERKVLRNKPTDAIDFCYLPSDLTFSRQINDFTTCDADPGLVKHQSPRQVAGGPVAENVLKCVLKPIDFNDSGYGGANFTEDQQRRMQLIFGEGVCDWTKPGVSQEVFDGPRTFAEEPGGKPLGPAPQSQACELTEGRECV